MSYAIGYRDGRFIGYGVPSICDSPRCNRVIDRGLAYKCGEDRIDSCCEQFFCLEHLYLHEFKREKISIFLCKRCDTHKAPYSVKPDPQEWVFHQLLDESWKKWRKENATLVKKLKKEYQV